MLIDNRETAAVTSPSEKDGIKFRVKRKPVPMVIPFLVDDNQLQKLYDGMPLVRLRLVDCFICLIGGNNATR